MISIIIPAKDEAENLKSLLPKLKKSLSSLKNKYRFEIIVVCDNCLDDTEKVAKCMGVVTLRRTKDPGKSKALCDGFHKAKGDILVMMDADLSHLPEELHLMLKPLKHKSVGLVIGSREMGKSDDATIIRRFGGLMFSFWFNLLFKTKLTDAINGYKAFRREIFDKYEYTATGYAIEIELVANTLRSGLKIIEIPSYEARREKGVAKSKIIKDGWLFLKEIFTEGIAYNLEKLAILVKKL